MCSAPNPLLVGHVNRRDRCGKSDNGKGSTSGKRIERYRGKVALYTSHQASVPASARTKRFLGAMSA